MEDREVDGYVVALFTEYISARESTSKWKKHEEKLRSELLEKLGYEPDDPKPPAIRGVSPTGIPLFEVNVSTRKGLDKEYLRKAYPAVYAEAEKTTPVKTIKALANDDDSA